MSPELRPSGSPASPTIWVVLPAYNEQSALPKLLPKLSNTLRSGPNGYRIVVIDDGSFDQTPHILAEFERSLPLDVLTHSINRGLGETERDGFEYVASRCGHDDVIVRVEGDDTHDPDYIFTLLDRLAEGFDVVNTSRFQPGGGQRGVNRSRAFVSQCANVFMRMLFPIPGLRDFSCGFRAYRAKVIRDAIRVFGNNFIQLRGMGFTSTLEILVKLDLLGCRFAEVPFVLRYDRKEGSSKMVGSITSLGYLMMVVLYRWPFGGWKRQYRGLSEAYRQDPESAIARYRRHVLPPKAIRDISI